ncbi:A disintegrin and metalloproteinase with thrombospondin motifs 17 isoform X3 [Oreochromis aureus]|uniref:A disintegrin and metalloproteinase with thrombospondin motifs 17 isoform X3 n=1 Tax=Oreochromis aureus TaxID=47969 RepID=UPI001953D713|nr:A disintegrin and metalloproteinase with thrombospondin motifs 17 isoform X3 [Oreochromis aureus]
MVNSHVVHLLFLFCIGFTAQSELETDEVIPRLLYGQEAHLSDHTTRTLQRRGQRSLDAAREGRWEPENIIVSLPAFGSNLHLNLTRDSTFLSKDFVVEERYKGKSAVVNSLSNNQLCFYSGAIINHTDSLASVSTCGGLMGFIQMGEESLFIQPAVVHDPSQSFSGLKHQLLRQSHSAKIKSGLDFKRSNYCGAVQGRKKDSSSKMNEEGRGKRDAIRLHKVYTLETVVVADSDMVQYHGGEAAQRFLLTVMNMVYNMFHHPSLGVRLDIRVTKLMLLYNRPEKLKVGHHGERSLESFCHWQHQEFGGPWYLGTNHVPGGRDDIPPVDSAVLVTRTDFCVHKDEPCDTVGIAYLGGVCSTKKKCVLAEDNGLNLAFTIAHELGHNMGMSHDDDHATCIGYSHIMSGEWVKGRNPSDLSWSSCSRNDLENFLRSKTSTCLLHTDLRRRYQVQLPPKLPGMHYSVVEQCQILFGTNATFCSEMEHLMCAGLWCLIEGETSCKTKLDPPLDGTECGADKWCRAGECVSKTPIPQHVDGDWSPWSQWSLCSRTCGTGVQFRQRKCDNPPPGPGGRHCPQTSVEHKACEAPPCPKGSPSFRDLQCLSYNQQANKKGGMLTAIVNDDKPCMLFCSPVGRDVPVLMADRVMDGTPCGPYEVDLCVNGRCQKIGCDSIIGSSAKEDRCGVCNGDGQSCKIVTGDFNHTRGMGQRRTVVSCMRIVNKTMEVVNDSYCQPENRPQPQVRLCNTHPCQYRWMTGEWGPCSVICGKGHQQREVLCLYHLQNGSVIHTRDLYCQGGKPPVVQGCEGRLCLTAWEASEWSKCSSNCGQGVRRRTVLCTNPQGLCDPLSQPTQEEYCEDFSKCYEWKTGDWSKCSSSCGKGLQSRVVQCMHKVTGRHGNNCSVMLRPPTYRSCHSGNCDEKINANTITSPRLAALTYKCLGDRWTVYCHVIRDKDLCQDMRWYQRCCETCRVFYANKILHKR